MSAWKRIALEKLPEYRGLIDDADSPMTLWVELHSKFENAYQAEITDHNLIRRFFEYARWCKQSPGEGRFLSDAGTAAVCAFYEHLPQHAGVRRDLPRWLTREEFADLRETFRHCLSTQEFTYWEAEFLTTTRRDVKR